MRLIWRDERDERGQSISVFAIVIMAALIITAGLVIDGGQKVAATSRAEAAAAGAARAAGNAGATGALAGDWDIDSARRAARGYLDGTPEVAGTVTIEDGVITVRTTAREPTIFLSVINIDSVVGRGSAIASIVAIGGTQ